MNRECWICFKEIQDNEMICFCDEFDTEYHAYHAKAENECPVCIGEGLIMETECNSIGGNDEK